MSWKITISLHETVSLTLNGYKSNEAIDLIFNNDVFFSSLIFVLRTKRMGCHTKKKPPKKNKFEVENE